jgi:hypothetical protein
MITHFIIAGWVLPRLTIPIEFKWRWVTHFRTHDKHIVGVFLTLSCMCPDFAVRPATVFIVFVSYAIVSMNFWSIITCNRAHSIHIVMV